MSAVNMLCGLFSLTFSNNTFGKCAILRDVLGLGGSAVSPNPERKKRKEKKHQTHVENFYAPHTANETLNLPPEIGGTTAKWKQMTKKKSFSLMK